MARHLDEKEIFRVATSLCDRSQRAAYLNSVCGADSALRSRVDELLAAHAEGDFISNAPVHQLDGKPAPAEVKPGATIGRYKILEQIGEGGFGIVYMADQIKPIQRRVAVKIIKAGMDTRQVIARFEAERQALALMDHPNIANVLDAGSTETGRPFFAMELVRGIPVTEYCDQRELSTKQRLRLFAEICSAVHHAHQKGIIHRDIKPSNILVGVYGDSPVAKVIDFGVAKATQGRLTDKTLFTQFRQFIGTPAYMSPEQAQTSAVDVDTRSDIYSLGVLLYELLSGKTPLDSQELVQAGLDEVCRRIREEEPSKPSTRFNQLTREEQESIAQQRGIEPVDLQVDLRGDLDWIAMKAIEKDRTQRYESASSLKLDIERFLRNEPVSAVAPTASYRFSKYLRRHQRAVAIAATFTGLLVIGTAVATWQAVQASRNAAEAETHAASAISARNEARISQQEAENARENESLARIRAEQLKYAANMNIVRSAIQTSDIRRAKKILEEAIPRDGEPDWRGWEWRFLYGQLHQELKVAQPNDSIHSIDVSSDGQRLATAGRAIGGGKGAVVVLDVNSLDIVQTLEHPSGWVAGVEFSPDGEALTVASHGELRTTSLETDEHTISRFDAWPLWRTPDRKFFVGMKRVNRNSLHYVKLRCFDADTGQQVTETQLYRLSDPVELEGEFAVGPDSRRVTVSCQGRVLRFFSVPDLVEVLAIDTPGEVSCVAWSKDGKYVATGYVYPWQIDVWRSDTGEHAQTLRGKQTSPVGDICFSPDGALLAVSESHYLIHAWDLKLTKERFVFLGHEAEPHSIRFLPDGVTLVSGGGDGALKFWDVSPVQQTDLRRASEVNSIWNLEFSPDGELLATSAADGIVRLFDAKTKKHVGQMGPGSNLLGSPAGWPQSRVRFSSDGRTLVVDNNDFTAGVYDVLSRSHRFNLTNPTRIYDLDISPDGNTIATAGFDEKLLFWDAQTGQEMFRVADRHKRTINKVRFSPDTQSRIVAFASDGEITVLHLDTKNERTAPVASTSWSLDFSRDGTILFCGCQHFVNVYEVSSLRLIETLDTGTGPVPNVAESPDGNTLAIPGWGGHVQLWSRKVDAEVGRLPLPLDAINCAKFSPDGMELVIATWGNGIFTFQVPSL